MTSDPTKPHPSRAPDPSRAPTLDQLEAIARKALYEIPEELRRHTAEIAFVIEDFPAEDICDEMGIACPFDLLGLYSGTPFGLAEGGDLAGDIDRIYLFRRPILNYWCESGEDLSHIMRHVLIHEIGHHFGFSDADMERIECAAPNSS